MKYEKNISVVVEPLEDRRLLSGSFFGHHGFEFGFGSGGFGFAFGGFEFGGFGGGGEGFSRGLNAIEFSQAPSKVQSGLNALAATDKLSAPAPTQTVHLGNQNGIETYTVDIAGTGTQSALTVDQNGNPVTAPTNGTTTYGAVPAPVSTEAAAIASALNLSVPASTATVRVNTPAGGTPVYTLRLTSSTSTTTHVRVRTFAINAAGDPLGSRNLPFDAIPVALQNALNSNRPTGATALASTSTQAVRIRTSTGVTTYSTSYTVGATSTAVTVDTTGSLAKLPSHSTATFSSLSTTVQTSINALAADNGVTGAISATQTVQVYAEANGTTIYSVNVNASKTGFSGNTFTYNLTISVDQNGNPTTVPGGGGKFGNRFGDFGGGIFFGGFGFFGRRHR